MQLGIGRFSSYVVDVPALLTEVKREYDERYAKTARRPCAVRMNPLDWHAVEIVFAAGRTGDAVAPGRLFEVPVVCVDDQPLGEIAITQCQKSLYRPGHCDCPQPR